MKTAILALICCAITYISFGQSNILPTPAFETLSGDSLSLSSPTLTVQGGAFDSVEFELLRAHFQTNGITLKEVNDNPHVSFSYRKNLLEEAYSMDISETIEIAYQSPQGRFYGLISLLFLSEVNENGTLRIAKGMLEDAPAFEWRGLHLDVSRHFFTVDEIKQFLSTMALYKFNTFHWHLTDDQGWRIEIEKYPKLTSVGGFRDSTVNGHYNDSPRTYNQERYGGYYTQDEIREVVAFAKSLHINVVPEIEMPGHSRAALAAYPELSCTGEKQGVAGLWGVFEDIYCSKEASIQFLQNVLDEVLELFPSEYIHIGGDEAPKTRWNNCAECQKVMDDNQLNDAHELQSYFIRRMDEFLSERGRKLIGWDEILEGGLSPNAAVMSWRGESGGIEAAKQGHEVVMSPTSYCYFDYYQSSHVSEPLAIGGYLPLEKVYQFRPVPDGLTKEEAKFILGGQANVWTEYITSYDHVEYMVYPRAIALMQSLWCQEKPDYASFLSIYLNYHEEFLKRCGVNRARSIHIPELTIERVEDGVGYAWTSLDSTQTYVLERSSVNRAVENEVEMVNGEWIHFRRGAEDQHLVLHFNDDQKNRYTVHQSDILGAEIELRTPAHKKYNHNGSLNLVDGIHGSIPWKGDQWLGFNTEEVEMIVKLDTVVQLNELKIGFLNQNGSWIYLPEALEIFVSNDQQEWKSAARMEIEGNETIERANVVLNAKGQFVRIVLLPMKEIPAGKGGAGNVPWTFVDEIQIEIE